jgi:predicted acyl esterase
MPDPQAIEKLNRLVESSGPPGTGPFEVHVARSFPLDQAAEAHRTLDESTILASLSCKRLSVSLTGGTSMMKEEFHVQAIERSQPRTRSCHAGPASISCRRDGHHRNAVAGDRRITSEEASMATILIDKNVMVPMRDGLRLATDVHRLDGATPAPVLLARTPYDKEHIVTASDTFDILRAVQAGYAVVIQDVRGRFASEGEFNPHFQEDRDGADTIAWTAVQPWSRGVVGTFGVSCLGCTQWLAAHERPQALRAIAPA